MAGCAEVGFYSSTSFTIGDDRQAPDVVGGSFVSAHIALTLTLVAMVAVLVPAWRASRMDPMIALRHE